MIKVSLHHVFLGSSDAAWGEIDFWGLDFERGTLWGWGIILPKVWQSHCLDQSCGNKIVTYGDMSISTIYLSYNIYQKFVAILECMTFEQCSPADSSGDYTW